MLDVHAVKSKNLHAFNRADLAEVAAQMLAHIGEQSRHISEQRLRIDSQAQAIKWRDAKIESITFQLARLKAWKFGARTEAMNAEQRSIFEETLAADQASLETQLAHLQPSFCAEDGKNPTQQPRRQPKREALPATSAACRSARGARGYELPNARMRPTHGARGRGHQRAAGHRAGAILRAAPDPGQVGLPVLPVDGAGESGPPGLRQRASNAGLASPHRDQPLRRSSAVLPARTDQRALGGAHAALDAGGVEWADWGAADAAV